MKSNEILDKYTKTCTCIGISKLAIKKSIENGNITVEDVFKDTKSGSGNCKGSFCKERIQDLINEIIDEKGKE